MIKVERRPNESDIQLLKRFRKKVLKSGLYSEYRRRRWHISKNELKRIKKKKAIRRIRRQQRKNNYRKKTR